MQVGTAGAGCGAVEDDRGMDFGKALRIEGATARRHHIVDTLTEAFADLMAADPVAFRTKFRKMAADPFAFYRGSACLFYADVAELDDPWADERTRRVWIQGDLHAENFGTYLNAQGVLVFDVNDFDEAYLGHSTWDLQRFAASMALLGWRKALPDADIDGLVETYLRAYLDQVRQFLDVDDDSDFSLRLGTAHGALEQLLQATRLRTRVELLDKITETEGYDRVFRNAAGVRRLDDDERAQVCTAFERYLETIPGSKRFRGIAYEVKDVIGRSGFGIGSAGLPAYSVLIEGYNQALDNDIVLSIKQGNVGRATAKIHCVSDSDSDQSLVPFQTEEAIAAVVENRDNDFVEWLIQFARDYAAVVRDDHRLFVEAFRNDEFSGVHSTANP
jgi:uncharacterized protein (DUF2252 family)